MKTTLHLLVVLGALLSSVASEKVRYDNYTVYRITPKDEAAVNHLRSLQDQYPSPYSFWTEVRGVGIPVDIMVAPENRNYVTLNIHEKLNVDSSIMMSNVQDNIDKEGLRPESRAGRFGWTDYYTFEEIQAWLESLPAKHPEVTLLNIGTTYENRAIYCVKISYSSANERNAVWLDSNIHAREWISSAVNTYILDAILNSNDPVIRQIAESHDWYFVPVANPDGFVYSHTTERMWRKTRVPYQGILSLCYGADPNRNWGYTWNQGGSSSLACSDTYHGPNEFSEPCTRDLSNYINTIADKLVAYFSFHSYSQMFLLPYGHTTDHLDNYNEMHEVGTMAQASMAKRYNTSYVLGNVAETIYIASGSSMDWIKGTHKTPIAFTYELRDTGVNGFILPAAQIIPSGEETLDSVATILTAGAKYVGNRTVV